MARNADGEPVTLIMPPGAEYPTADGRRLRFADGEQVRAALGLRNLTGYGRNPDLDPNDEPATDVLAADLRVADEAGRLWQATARFSSGLLVSKLVDLESTLASVPTQVRG